MDKGFDYKIKYLKYKMKYIKLKQIISKQTGGYYTKERNTNNYTENSKKNIVHSSLCANNEEFCTEHNIINKVQKYDIKLSSCYF